MLEPADCTGGYAQTPGKCSAWAAGCQTGPLGVKKDNDIYSSFEIKKNLNEAGNKAMSDHFPQHAVRFEFFFFLIFQPKVDKVVILSGNVLNHIKIKLSLCADVNKSR